MEFACPARSPRRWRRSSTTTSDSFRRQLLRALTNGKEEWGYPGAVDLSDMGCHAKGQLIRMADGTKKRVEDIVVGESVAGLNGPQKSPSCRGHGDDGASDTVLRDVEPWTVNLSHT